MRKMSVVYVRPDVKARAQVSIFKVPALSHIVVNRMYSQIYHQSLFITRPKPSHSVFACTYQQLASFSVILSGEALWVIQAIGWLQIAMEPRPTALTAAGTRTTNPAVRWWTALMTPTSSTPTGQRPRCCCKTQHLSFNCLFQRNSPSRRQWWLISRLLERRASPPIWTIW